MKISTCLLLQFLCLANSTLTLAQESQKLRWSLKQDEELSVVLAQNTGIKTLLDNRAQEIGNEMVMEMQWKVLGVNDDKFRLEQKISRIKLTINAPGKAGIKITKVDTADQTPPKDFAAQLLDQVQPLIGTVYQVTMNDRGEILDVEIPEASLKVLRQAPASMQIRKVISKDGLKNMFGQSAVVFPDAAVEVGFQWEANSVMDNEIGTIKRTNKYEIVSSDKNITEISATSAATLNNPKKEIELSAYSGSGKFKFFPQGKSVVDSEMNTTMTTSRDFREKTIQSTVTTEVFIKVSRKSE